MIQPNDNRPEHIIIHHSASPDNPRCNDWEGIRKYHMSYRYNGQIITQEHAKMLAGAGVKDGLEWPWQDIGYHYGLEYEGGYIKVRTGRNELTHGAHCLEQEMNYHSLGICVIGNYDRQPPMDEMVGKLVELCAGLCQKYNVPLANVAPHRRYAIHPGEFSPYKTCPGLAFPWGGLVGGLMARGIK